MWFRCSQHITLAAILCSVALINPVFQNILLYFIKGSTQIHSNFDPIMLLNTMNIERHTLFCRNWFELNSQTSYNDEWDKFCAPSYCKRAVRFMMVFWCLLDGLFSTSGFICWSHKWSYVYFTPVQSKISKILTQIVINHCDAFTIFQHL